MIHKKCATCGKEMIVWPCVSERTKYCSVRCQILGGNSNTDIELIVKDWLDKNNVTYIQQYNIGKYLADFYLSDCNIAIEVQGDYWHGNPQMYNAEDLNEQQKDHMRRDKRKFGYYKKEGIKFYELWGQDIKENIHDAMKSIKELKFA